METNDRARAIDTMLQYFPEILEVFWEKKHAIVRTMDFGYLSGGQRILVDAALSIWNGKLAKVDLEGVIGNLDDRNFNAFIDAVKIARGRSLSICRPAIQETSASEDWYKKFAFCRPADLNSKERDVLISCVASSESNGHDFGIVEELTGGDGSQDWYGRYKPRELSVNQIKGYISQLQYKGYISVYDPEKVNFEYWVTQFVLTPRGREVFGVVDY